MRYCVIEGTIQSRLSSGFVKGCQWRQMAEELRPVKNTRWNKAHVKRRYSRDLPFGGHNRKYHQQWWHLKWRHCCLRHDLVEGPNQLILAGSVSTKYDQMVGKPHPMGFQLRISNIRPLDISVLHLKANRLGEIGNSPILGSFRFWNSRDHQTSSRRESGENLVIISFLIAFMPAHRRPKFDGQGFSRYMP